MGKHIKSTGFVKCIIAKDLHSNPYQAINADPLTVGCVVGLADHSFHLKDRFQSEVPVKARLLDRPETAISRLQLVTFISLSRARKAPALSHAR